MSEPTFTIDDLMALLVAKVGLPRQDRSDDPQGTFVDLGLDSLAFLQLQAEIKARYGVELPGDRPLAYTFGEIVASVNNQPARAQERVA
jgi:acyl carrier protein